MEMAAFRLAFAAALVCCLLPSSREFGRRLAAPFASHRERLIVTGVLRGIARADLNRALPFLQVRGGLLQLRRVGPHFLASRPNIRCMHRGRFGRATCVLFHVQLTLCVCVCV